MSQMRLMPLFTSREAFSKYFENGSKDPDTSNGIPNTLQKATDTEAVHYETIFCHPMLQKMHNKEAYIIHLIYNLGCQVGQIDESQEACLQL